MPNAGVLRQNGNVGMRVSWCTTRRHVPNTCNGERPCPDLGVCDALCQPIGKHAGFAYACQWWLATRTSTTATVGTRALSMESGSAPIVGLRLSVVLRVSARGAWSLD